MQNGWLPRMIVLDLDGTLLHSDGHVSKRTLSILRAYRQTGCRMVIATARFWFKAERYIDLLAPDDAILADGTQVFHEVEMILGYPMEERASGVIADLLSLEPRRDLIVCTGKRLLLSQTGIHEPWRESFDFRQPLTAPIYKIAAFLDSPGTARAIAERRRCQLHTYHGEQLYGFTHPDSGKLRAVQALADALGISMRDVMAFGDDRNDLELLRHCGRGIAMANAAPDIRQAAHDVTVANDEDGVAVYLERLMGSCTKFPGVVE